MIHVHIPETAKHRRRLGRLHGSSLCRCQGGRSSSAARSGVAPVTRNGGTPKDEDLAGCFTVRPKSLGIYRAGTNLELEVISSQAKAPKLHSGLQSRCHSAPWHPRGFHPADTESQPGHHAGQNVRPNGPIHPLSFEV